ncbi:hypothetical protein CMQ_4991 [Grosmannia clavigera kw1407]|uniref:Uncharacterized protein n=1 Tax=Grosmannia clavigera (strain kw1407 / UAMH 11150) TaxID=655863 RepID=F0XK53_GROCL|nr:uncharacterized protein CMQ_4991 [Grosmannia clavigera kw1407]EFX01920.1 hypothetical protein CMQ_4991 [Grosmannia clavigera kw1407]
MAERLLYSPAIEVSIHRPLSYLRQLAVDASPDEAGLLRAQRQLLRSATARLHRKGLSTDTETYRRLGILIPPWRYPVAFEQTLNALRDYWRRHRTAKTLGCAAPYRQARDRAAEYLRMLADFGDGDGDGCVHADDDNPDDDDDPDSSTRFAHLLPSSTDMRVFRLVNGNLEIPSTLLKALASAGRIEDAFFPDEPTTWQMSAASREADDGAGDADDADVIDVDEHLFVDAVELPIDDDDNVHNAQELMSPVAIRRVREATAHFLRQLQQPNHQDVGSSSSVGPLNSRRASDTNRLLRRLLDLHQGHGTYTDIPPIIICPLPVLLPGSAASMAAMASMASMAALSAVSPVVVPADAVGLSSLLSKLNAEADSIASSSSSLTSSSYAGSVDSASSRSSSRTSHSSTSSSSSSSSASSAYSSRKHRLPVIDERPKKKHGSRDWLDSVFD